MLDLDQKEWIEREEDQIDWRVELGIDGIFWKEWIYQTIAEETDYLIERVIEE